MDDTRWLNVIYLLLVLVLIAPMLRRRSSGRWLVHAALWLAILTGLIFAYENWFR